jgi:hypothetical protein
MNICCESLKNYPPKLKYFVEIKINNEKGYMFVSEILYKKLKEINNGNKIEIISYENQNNK